MDWKALDVDGFRAIHIGLHSAWLSPIMLVITASGLGHIQVAALFARHYLATNAHIALRVLGVLLVLSVPINGYLEGLMGWHVAALLFAFFYFYPASREMTKRAVWAFIVSGISQIIIKQIIPDRMRPSNFAWANPLEHVYKTAGFPSGHTTTSVAIGTALAIGFFYEKRPVLGSIMLLYGLLVGFSRIYVGVHYPTDVLAGICVGIASAAAVTLAMPYEKETNWQPLGIKS